MTKGPNGVTMEFDGLQKCNETQLVTLSYIHQRMETVKSFRISIPYTEK